MNRISEQIGSILEIEPIYKVADSGLARYSVKSVGNLVRRTFEVRCTW